MTEIIPRLAETQPHETAPIHSSSGSQSAEATLTPAAGTLLTNEQIRWLRRAVMAMTTVLVAGVVVLIGRVIYLARGPGTQAASVAATSAASQSPLLTEITMPLPVGTEIKSVATTGNRLTVWHRSPGGPDGIVILDLSSGQVLSRITIETAR